MLRKRSIAETHAIRQVQGRRSPRRCPPAAGSISELGPGLSLLCPDALQRRHCQGHHASQIASIVAAIVRVGCRTFARASLFLDLLVFKVFALFVDLARNLSILWRSDFPLWRRTIFRGISSRKSGLSILHPPQETNFLGDRNSPKIFHSCKLNGRNLQKEEQSRPSVTCAQNARRRG